LSSPRDGTPPRGRYGPPGAALDGHSQNLASGSQRDPFDAGQHRRVNLAQLMGDVGQRFVAGFLADNVASHIYAEEHASPAMVEEGAEGAGGIRALPGG